MLECIVAVLTFVLDEIIGTTICISNLLTECKDHLLLVLIKDQLVVGRFVPNDIAEAIDIELSPLSILKIEALDCRNGKQMFFFSESSADLFTNVGTILSIFRCTDFDLGFTVAYLSSVYCRLCNPLLTEKGVVSKGVNYNSA